MRGVIVHLKKYRGGYMFIEGEDGVTYFSHSRYVKNKMKDEYWCEGYWLNTWDVYGYEGNSCSFDVSDDIKDKEGKPVAVNVIVDTAEYDPRLHEKLLTKRRGEENKARREKNRLKAENKRMAKDVELKKWVRKS